MKVILKDDGRVIEGTPGEIIRVMRHTSFARYSTDAEFMSSVSFRAPPRGRGLVRTRNCLEFLTDLAEVGELWVVP